VLSKLNSNSFGERLLNVFFHSHRLVEKNAIVENGNNIEKINITNNHTV
jgi:hypothetical protein